MGLGMGGFCEICIISSLIIRENSEEKDDNTMNSFVANRAKMRPIFVEERKSRVRGKMEVTFVFGQKASSSCLTISLEIYLNVQINIARVPDPGRNLSECADQHCPRCLNAIVTKIHHKSSIPNIRPKSSFQRRLHNCFKNYDVVTTVAFHHLRDTVITTPPSVIASSQQLLLPRDCRLIAFQVPSPAHTYTQSYLPPPKLLMANRTVQTAAAVHSIHDPQKLLSNIVRPKIQEDRFWKEFLFGCNAAELVEIAVNHVRCIGATYGGRRRPSKFLCCLLKLLQLGPEKEIILAYICCNKVKLSPWNSTP